MIPASIPTQPISPKNKVVAVFGPGNAINPDRTIEIIGECRDVTTTKDTRGGVDTAAL
jgi:hypothetical protein